MKHSSTIDKTAFHRIIYLVIFFFLLAGNLCAQKHEHRKHYEAGKTELKNKNYEKALELFKKASVEHHENLNKINATYFYAFCAYKLKQYWSANHYLNKILTKYPTWNKISEVHYLLALMSFEKHEYTPAVMWTQKIQSRFLKNDVDNLKWNYLNFPSLKDTVTELNKKMPLDTTIGTILYYLVKDDSGWKNKKLVKKLTEDYKIITEPIQETEPVVLNTVPKDSLRIAVLLPFNLKENISHQEIKNNAYLFHLYNGIRFAADSMRKSGSKIRIVAYDYGKDSADFIKFIEKPELAMYDIMIGPLQNYAAARINKFAQVTNTMIINPLSTNIKFTEGSEKVYLFKTSAETQAKKVAGFASTHFQPKKALIVSSKVSKDSLLASIFKTSFDSIGGKTLGSLTLSNSNLPKMEAFFQKKTTDSTGVIFVSTKDQYLGVSIVRKLTELDRSTPLLVYDEWIDFQSMDFDQMKKHNIYFIGTDYINMEADTIKSVSRSLFHKTHAIPSIYTFTGYELIYHLAQLAKNDPAFFNKPDFKNLPYRPGFLFKGICYQNTKDNSIFTIQRFTDAGFEEIK